jgi:hypothetical protein
MKYFSKKQNKTSKNQTSKKQTSKNKTYKKTKCSPAVKNKTLNGETCFTPDILGKIKNEYNKSKPKSKQIKTTDNNEIWKELRARLVHCKKEKCWLNQIKSPMMKKKIKEYIFVPDQPPEWKKNPNTWLSNFDILEVLKQYEKAYPDFEFIGPTPIDFDTRLDKTSCVTQDLCLFDLKTQIEKGKRKIGIIFNLDKHNENGSHWVSMFIDINEKIIFYMDSNGVPAPPEVDVFIKRVINQSNNLLEPIVFRVIINNIEHQQENTECGMYSLFFIITMLTGEVEYDVTPNMEIKSCDKLATDKLATGCQKKIMTISDKINLFSRYKIPDKYVEQFRNKYFSV